MRGSRPQTVTRTSFACVARSDHHSVDGLKNRDAATYVKVSRRDLSCVRDALVFHETRVRFADDLPATPSPRIVGLRLRSPDDGLFEDATIAFNENLNCLIGPRGTGKSTIVEALRYALGQRPLLEASEEREADERSFARLAVATQKANLKNTEIEVIYERESERRVLTSTYDPERGVTTRVFTLDGQDCHVQPEGLPAAFPARIFSWSEIERSCAGSTK